MFFLYFKLSQKNNTRAFYLMSLSIRSKLKSNQKFNEFLLAICQYFKCFNPIEAHLDVLKHTDHTKNNKHFTKPIQFIVVFKRYQRTKNRTDKHVNHAKAHSETESSTWHFFDFVHHRSHLCSLQKPNSVCFKTSLKWFKRISIVLDIRVSFCNKQSSTIKKRNINQNEVLNIFKMFDTLLPEYGAKNQRHDYSEIVNMTVLTLVMIILGFVVLVFLLAIVYVILVYARRLYAQFCASCRYSEINNSQPPSYDSLCNYYKFFYISCFFYCYYFWNLPNFNDFLLPSPILIQNRI